MQQEGKMRVGVVGCGFVGGAVEYAFTHPNVDKCLVDPKLWSDIDDLLNFDPHFTFICLPAPTDNKGVDDRLIWDYVGPLLELTGSTISIKSTLTPDLVDTLCQHRRVVYNPEFLIQSNAKEQFVNAKYHIFGGEEYSCKALEYLYRNYSICIADEYVHMTPAEASFVKYGVNSFLSTKVTFFNQLFDSIKSFEFANPSVVINAIGKDPRIGHGHTRVPGHDRKQGYGGSCFPKDTDAFTKFDKNLTLIKKSIEINKDYRNGEENN